MAPQETKFATSEPGTQAATTEDSEHKPSALGFLPEMSQRGLIATYTRFGLTRDEINVALDPLLDAFQAAPPAVKTGYTSPLVGVAEKALREAHTKKHGMSLSAHMDLLNAGNSKPEQPRRGGRIRSLFSHR